MKNIAVVLVDWNGYEVTRQCISSLNSINPLGIGRVKIIVVDNGSDIPTKSILEQECNHVTFLRSEVNLGFAGGNNIGIKYALENGFGYTLLLNNDTTVDPNFLQPLVKALEENENVAAVQPKIYFAHDQKLLWNAGNKFDRIFGTTSTRGYKEYDQGQFDEIQSMPWITGCCMLINNEILKTMGPTYLNEQYKTYFEDVEFSFRLKNAGYNLLYVPASKIWHIAGYSAERNTDKEGKKFPEIVYLHTRNKIWIARAHAYKMTKPLAMAWQYSYCLLLMVYYAIKGRWKKYNNVIQAMQDGWRTQPC